MINKDIYSKAYTEVEAVLLILDDSLKKKIPEEIMKALKEKNDKEYIFNYDFSQPIHKQNICIEAQFILADIYKKYLCSDEERKKWKEYDLFCLSKREEAKKQKFKDTYLKFNKK